MEFTLLKDTTRKGFLILKDGDTNTKPVIKNKIKEGEECLSFNDNTLDGDKKEKLETALRNYLENEADTPDGIFNGYKVTNFSVTRKRKDNALAYSMCMPVASMAYLLPCPNVDNMNVDWKSYLLPVFLVTHDPGQSCIQGCQVDYPDHLVFKFEKRKDEIEELITIPKLIKVTDSGNEDWITSAIQLLKGILLCYNEDLFLARQFLIINEIDAEDQDRDALIGMLSKLIKTGDDGSNVLDSNALKDNPDLFKVKLMGGLSRGGGAFYESRSTISMFLRYIRNLCKYIYYTYGPDQARKTRLLVDNASTHLTTAVDKGKVSTLHRLVQVELFPYNVFDVIFTPVRDPHNMAAEYAFSKMKRGMAVSNTKSVLSISELMTEMQASARNITKSNVVQFFRMGCWPLTSLSMWQDGETVIPGYVKKNNFFVNTKTNEQFKVLPSTSFCNNKSKSIRNRFSAKSLHKDVIISEEDKKSITSLQNVIDEFPFVQSHLKTLRESLNSVASIDSSAEKVLQMHTNTKHDTIDIETGLPDDSVTEFVGKLLYLCKVTAVLPAQNTKQVASIEYFIGPGGEIGEIKDALLSSVFPVRSTSQGELHTQRDKNIQMLSCSENTTDADGFRFAGSLVVSFFGLNADTKSSVTKFVSMNACTH